ncbi:MAG: ankyrin repeat domain-containing protein, partial [Rhodanobacteraceae bacterium]
HLAVQTGQLEVVRALIAHKADVNSRGYEGATPLLEAAKLDNLDLIKLLVVSGADTDAEMSGSITGNAVKVAEVTGHPDIAEWLRLQQTASAH